MCSTDWRAAQDYSKAFSLEAVPKQTLEEIVVAFAARDRAESEDAQKLAMRLLSGQDCVANT